MQMKKAMLQIIGMNNNEYLILIKSSLEQNV